VFCGVQQVRGQNVTGDPVQGQIGERLRELRRRAMVSQAELARLAGIGRGTIVNMEAERTEPQGATLRLLAQALRLEPAEAHWLLTGEILPLTALDPEPEPEPTDSLDLPFIGRADDLAEIAAILADPATRLLTLTGPGGIGKTRLAMELAAAAARQTQLNRGGFHAVDFVPLANLSDAADVFPAVATALQVPITGSVRDTLALALSGPRRLLVLDNLEHLSEVTPEIAWLLRNAPGLVILATSREALLARGERVVVVRPLSTKSLASPAVELFTKLARQSRGTIDDSDGAREVIRAVCERLGGFPLAIELAAAQMDVFTPADLLALMNDAGLGALAPALTDETHRFSTMDDAIAWSVDRLAPEDQRLLRVLSVIPGSFPVDFAAGVLAGIPPGTPPDAHAVGAALARLARVHLIQIQPGGEGRFMMLEPIRLFALGRLRRNGEEDAVLRAHATYTAARFSALDERVRRNQIAEMALFAEEYPNGRAALDWAIDAGEADIASRLVSSLKYAQMFQYRAAELVSQLDRLAPRSAALTPEARLWVHYERAELASRDADPGRLRAVLSAAIDDARATGDPLIEAMALLYWSCDLDEAPETALATIDRVRDLLGEDRDTMDPPFLQTWAITRRGVELHRLGRLEEARAALECGISRKQQEGNAIGNGPLLAHLGRVQQDLGYPRLAAESLLAALGLAANLDDAWLLFHAARWLSTVARTGGPRAREIADALDAALATERASHGYLLGQDDELPARKPVPGAEPLTLREAVSRAASLPDMLPRRANPAPVADFQGVRLE
jgi:predicted ATPase/DNA-binding XRE family transcriptional regulator